MCKMTHLMLLARIGAMAITMVILTPILLALFALAMDGFENWMSGK